MSRDYQGAAVRLTKDLLGLTCLDFPAADVIRSDEHLGYLAGALRDLDNARATDPELEREDRIIEEVERIEELALERIEELIEEEDLETVPLGPEESR